MGLRLIISNTRNGRKKIKMNNRLQSQQVQEILKDYPNLKSSVLAEKYQVPVEKIYSTAKRYGIKKSEEFKLSDQSGLIKKGQHLAPGTEIKKGQRMMGPRRRNKTKLPHPTAWRKGNIGPLTAKDGEIRWRTVGWMIRINLNNWMFYTRWLWIQKYGEIAEGWNVVFKDGFSNSKDHIPTIEQLECVSNAGLLNMNSGCEELTDGYVVSKLSHKNPILKQVFSKMPELIELKRNEIKLRRTINELEEVTKNDR